MNCAAKSELKRETSKVNYQFAKLPIVFIRHPKLGHMELAVLAVLIAYAGADGDCRPSVSTIAGDARMSERSVHRSLQTLKDIGIVSWQRRSKGVGGRASNSYKIHPHNPTCHRGRLHTRQFGRS